MNYRSLLLVCLATLGLVVAGWGQTVTSSDGEAWVAGDIRRLTDASGNDSSPSWSPDGRSIAFTSDRDGNREIYVMDANGDNLQNLTNDSSQDRSPSWSPDGRSIVFTSDRVGGGNYEIYVMDANGDNVRRLTDHPAEDRAPSWSPDGRHITFDSNRDGDYEIYVMDIASYTGGEPTAAVETSWGQIKSLLSIGTH